MFIAGACRGIPIQYIFFYRENPRSHWLRKHQGSRMTDLEILEYVYSVNGCNPTLSLMCDFGGLFLT